MLQQHEAVVAGCEERSLQPMRSRHISGAFDDESTYSFTCHREELNPTRTGHIEAMNKTYGGLKLQNSEVTKCPETTKVQ